MPVWVGKKGNPSNKRVLSSEYFAKPPPPKPLLDPGPLVPFIDGVSLSMDFPGHPQALDVVLVKLQTGPYVKAGKPTQQYGSVNLISFPGTTHRARLATSPKKSYFRPIHLSFNPSKIGKENLGHLHKILLHILPGGWGWVMEKASLSRVDVTIDLPGARMHQIHVLPKRTADWKTIYYGWKVKTTYHGKSTGNQLLVYSKSHERWVKGGGPKGPPVVRIEYRLRNTGHNLITLASMKNPFTRFTIVDLPSDPPFSKTGKWDEAWASFVQKVPDISLGKAMSQLDVKTRAAFRKHLQGHVQPWWKPEAIWAKWPAAVANLTKGQVEG